MTRSISFTVFGEPPAKNEARSLFAAGHVHAVRVPLLLEAAQEALAASDWDPATDRYLALEVVLRSASIPRADATNYLGGIADVIEDKARRGLAHLGDTALVALYPNDRQIQEVSYRWEQCEGESSYTVTLRELEPGAESSQGRL